MEKSEFEIINELKSSYTGKKLNEAETRFKVIDTILEDVLKWPKSNITVEKEINRSFADYILLDRFKRPRLVIESKKSGEYFKLPTNSNSKKSYQKVALEKLLTDKHIKKAVLQVKGYAEDILCNYAAICNGNVWIIFKISSNIKPWKKLPAFVIRDIGFFVDEYTTAINLLGFTSVLDENSIQTAIGFSKSSNTEIFYPKNNIVSYNTPVNSNAFSGPLNNIARKYLGAINESDHDFMKACYVSNKGHYDDLQRNMHGFLYDSLTPFFKNEGVKNFNDDKKGGAFGLKIAETIKKENLDNVMILFGGRGSGKSTFLKRFLFHVKPEEIVNYSHIALIDLLNSAQTKDELTKEIWAKILDNIDSDNVKEGSRDEIISLFQDDYEIFKSQFLVDISDSSDKFHDLTSEFIKDKLSDIKGFCEKLSLKWKERNKGLIIFLDNMDQLSPELQDTCFLTAIEVAKKLSCLSIISMREERFYEAKNRGVLDAYHTPGYHLTSPVIPDVITKRIYYIQKKLKNSNDLSYDFGIDKDDRDTIDSFFSICYKQLRKRKSPLSYFLRFATHGDVRQALEFFKGFLTSGYTNIHEMAPHQDWTFQIHQVIKPMMIPDRFFYDEKLSKIPNLFQLRNDINSSHFTGLRILQNLHNKTGDKSNSGFIDAKYFVQEFEAKYHLKEDCEKYLDLFLQKGLIESNNRLEVYNEKVDHFKITVFGEYIFEHLAFTFVYLDLICYDCGIFDEKLNNSLISSANDELRFYYDRDFMSRIKLRLEKVSEFIDYLELEEQKEIKDLGLGKNEKVFSKKLRGDFEIRKQIILRSAQKKLED